MAPAMHVSPGQTHLIRCSMDYLCLATARAAAQAPSMVIQEVHSMHGLTPAHSIAELPAALDEEDSGGRDLRRHVLHSGASVRLTHAGLNKALWRYLRRVSYERPNMAKECPSVKSLCSMHSSGLESVRAKSHNGLPLTASELRSQFWSVFTYRMDGIHGHDVEIAS